MAFVLFPDLFPYPTWEDVRPHGFIMVTRMASSNAQSCD